MDYKFFQENKDYDFLRENQHLGSNIGMLCLGGSLAYGTNLPGKGDIDLRGFAFETKEELIGLTPNFEQVINTQTDTTIYSFNKLIKLLISNNPNMIELLGCREEDIFFKTPVAEEMIKNRKMFLSKKCINSFGGYANQQLSRLENAIARDRVNNDKKEEHIKRSLENVLIFSKDKYQDNNGVKLYIDKSNKTGMNNEIFIDIDLLHYPLRDLKGLLNEFVNVVKDYDKLNSRNNKKDNEHLNKHAMHLIRLYYTAIDILETGDINIYRAKEHEELLDIRRGKFMNADGSYQSEFFDLKNKLEKRFDYAKKHTELPESPNIKRIEEFVIDTNMSRLTK